MIFNAVITQYEKDVRKTTTLSLPFEDDGGIENTVINLYPSFQGQTLDGFGGAVTESAAYVYSRMSKEDQNRLIQEYFGADAMKYRLVRVPIDSCDFSLSHYEADSDPDDENLSSFSMGRTEKYILPMLRDIQAAAGEPISLMLSPWSPPAYMKTTGERNHGGKLLEQYRERYAEYICRYIEEFLSRGFRVSMLTLQNEPKAVQRWDSCIWTAEEEKRFLSDFVTPALKKHGLSHIGVYLWDHNKERVYEWAETILDEKTAPLAAGMAFHWYSGDHFEALQMIRERYPDKKLLVSEACIEYSRFSADDFTGNAERYAHEILGDLNAGMNAFIDWNLLLDEQGGPNHVSNFCDAAYLFDTGKNKLKETAIRPYLWHFSHYLEPGSVRIGMTRYTEQIEGTAFEKDGQIALVLLNRTDMNLPAVVRLYDRCVHITLPARSILSAALSGI